MPDYHVTPNDSRGGWDVTKEGGERASRHFDRKVDAEAWADQAKGAEGNVISHRKDGTIQGDNTARRRDPNPPLDRE